MIELTKHVFSFTDEPAVVDKVLDVVRDGDISVVDDCTVQLVVRDECV